MSKISTFLRGLGDKDLQKFKVLARSNAAGACRFVASSGASASTDLFCAIHDGTINDEVRAEIRRREQG